MRTRFRSLVVVVAVVCVGWVVALASDGDVLRIGIVADVHAHDTNSPGESKVMVNYAERITAFVDAMNAWPADAVIQLGDLVNGAFVMGAALGDVTRIAGLLDEAIVLLSGLESLLYHVLGNHDMYDLSKPEVLAATGLEIGHYSFDIGDFHFVVLDAEYNPDGTDYDHVFMRTKGFIPPMQLDWLVADLTATTLPTIVCVHQPIDSDFEALAGGPPVVNNTEVRQLLSEFDDVIAVFQGHDHENRYAVIDGIHYVTFAAMVDHTEPTPPSWAAVELDPSARTITIEGAGLQDDLQLTY